MDWMRWVTPFNLSADTAQQKDAQTVILHNLTADMTLKDEAWLSILAHEGELDLEEKTMILTGTVQLFHDEGYEFRTETGILEVKTGVAWGDDPVEAQGSMGHLKARGFRIEERGKRIHFKGPVAMTIYPGKAGL